jgi:3-hydroxyisobutyrate dehydrogenase
MARIAFIGLGAMGGGMAATLARKGHAVSAFDLDAGAVARAADAGCRSATTLKAAVAGAEAVVTMLPAGAHVLSVLTGPDGVLVHAERDAILMDCSTVAVEDARQAIAAAEATGRAMVDAPVSGGVAAAAAGALTFMVGGAASAFERAKPILSDMGKAVIHAGTPGAGQAAKICNNMLLGVSMIATCEAFVLAEKLGLDARAFFEIASQSSGQCWSMTSYAPVAGLVPTAPVNRDFANGFAGALMLKDLTLASEAASSGQVDARMGALAMKIYGEYVENFDPARDFSGVIDMLRNR